MSSTNQELPVPEGWFCPNPDLDPSYILPVPQFVTSTTKAALDKTQDFIAAKTISSHRVAYTQYGDPIYNEQHKVLFTVHGVTGDSGNFHYLSKYLQSKGYCVINIDIVGRGSSDNLSCRADYTYTQYCIDILCILNHIINNIINTSNDAYCKDNKYYWLGTSMGGLLGMILPTIYKQYNKLLFTKPMIIDDNDNNNNESHKNQSLFSAVILNDIGPSVRYRNIQNIEPIYFNTRIDAAKYWYNTYHELFGPFVDDQFFLHRALTSLIQVEISQDIVSIGEEKQENQEVNGMKTVYTARHDLKALMHGIYDEELDEIDIFCDNNNNSNNNNDEIKSLLLQYGKPYNPYDSQQNIILQKKDNNDITKKEFFDQYFQKREKQQQDNNNNQKYYYSFWSYFNTLNCPVLLYHGETSTLLNDKQIEQIKISHIEKNKQNLSYIKWSLTGHVPPLYKEVEFIPIEEHLMRY